MQQSAQTIRNAFLPHCAEIIERVSRAFVDGTPASKLNESQREILRHVWPTVHTVVTSAEDPVSIAWGDKDTQGRINEVLCQVASGSITPEQGQRLVALVGLGLEAIEVPEMLKQLSALEAR